MFVILMKVLVGQLLIYAPLPVWNELRVAVGMTVIDEQDSPSQSRIVVICRIYDKDFTQIARCGVASSHGTTDEQCLDGRTTFK
ncbi:hypothetical protein AB4Y42_11515 [Paraburkholderia sp. EG286B]|uniref:hypothetical protein n=1 Tax=Paraburkholderia sp. EG286B TaxID=3237011 RepID=UPI0034D1CF2F